MIISFFDVEKSEQPIFEKAISGHKLLFHQDSLTEKKAAENNQTEILYVRSLSIVSSAILKNLPKLKFIASRSTGVDHIDLNYCRQRGVVVSHVPAYATNSVAEHTMMLILSLAHKMLPSIQQLRLGHFHAEDLRGSELIGKTLGVIGLGNIGSRVVEIAKGFGMKILATTKHPSKARAEKHQLKFVELKKLLRECDIVTLHVPLTDETYHLINKNNIILMKKGSLLINTARGAVVDTKALIWALDKGIIKGAGLDVLEGEENPKIWRKSYKLFKEKNVIITPHNGYNSMEAIRTILDISALNIKAYLKGKPIHRVV